MNKQTLKYIALALLTYISSPILAQTTVQSPYSKFGLGNLKGPALPQLRAMGGISTGISRTSYIDNINTQNPAAYASVHLTTLDIGMYGTFSSIQSGGLTEKNFNSSLNHLVMAFPVSRKSALSAGLLPYSELGYNFMTSLNIGTNANNTKTAHFLYNGEGGLSKAYLGYGIQFGDYFRVGANAEYLFGNLIQSNSTEYQNDPGAINSRNQTKNSIYGINLKFGTQYDIKLNNKTTATIGYALSTAGQLNSELSKYATIYRNDFTGAEQSAIDTLELLENGQTNLKLPATHSFGFSIYKENKWLIGADFHTANWSKLSIANVNQNLNNTTGFAIGGQFTPDASAINGYFKRVDYRLGFQHEKTYVQVNGQDIKQTAVTFGLGLPLTSYARSSFYKINISAEVGKRGKVSNSLIREGYFNIHLGFMLNDKWFQRFKFD